VYDIVSTRKYKLIVNLLLITYFEIPKKTIINKNKGHQNNVLLLTSKFLSRSFKSVNSIKNYLSGVKLLHLYLDDDYPKFDEFQLKLTLK
jgi:hypothetical protein